MKSVFVSYFYPPFNVPRAIQVARLAEHIALRPLTIICAGNVCGAGGSVSTRAEDVRIERLPASRLFQSVHSGSKLGRILRTAYRPIRGFTQAPDVYRPWAMNAARHVLSQHRLGPDDLLVTFGQPMSDHLAGYAVKQSTGVRWIAHFSDPWVDNPFRHDGVWAKRKNARWERRVIEAADRVIFTSAETQDLVMEKYPAAWKDKTRVLAHAYDPSLYPARRVRQPGEPLIIRYLGRFYGTRSPEVLYRPLEMLLRRRSDLRKAFRIELICEGERTGPRRDKQFSDILKFSAPVDYPTSLRLMVDADALLLIDAPAASSVFLPSKLIDYIGAGRPILAITPPGTSFNLVKRLGGEAVVPSEPDQVSAVVERFVDGLRSGQPVRSNASDDVRFEFAAKNVAGEMKEIIDEAVREGQR